MMVDWNDNAKAAVKEFAEYVGQTKHCERYLERNVPEQQKTVADAVERLGKQVLSHEWDVILYDGDSYYPVSDNYAKKWEHQIICTRDEFEAFLSEQRSDDWTHIDEDGSICRILHTIDDKAWVTYKCKNYLDDVVKLIDLKPYEPEWTHLDETNEPCKVVSDTPDAKGWIVILKKKTGMYEICPKGHVQPCH